MSLEAALPERDAIALRHMYDAAERLLRHARGRTRTDLDEDDLFGLASVRLLEVIGEAANRVDPAVRSRYPSIRWSDIRGMRNRLIHAYDEVDYDIVWVVIADELDGLARELGQILGIAE